MTAESIEVIEIFYSYAYQDEELRNQLDKHLSSMKRQGLIVGWHSRLISPGADWAKEVDTRLNTAHIILLLISADFLSSSYCTGIEMQRALERHEAGEARVIPIILRPVDWEHESRLNQLKLLPNEAKPVTTWLTASGYDEAFVDIARGIRKAVEDYRRTPSLKSPQNAQIWNIPFRRNPFF